ncbi:Development/cell death domain containing protein [Trema orientale]|uniref:Development/cell death domain containing protein n=1 Tax=Trema orientale TaxID=63057 RepID=A0A2P5CB82_TREOI|nr:Development/cell death domain containing protein [Trema orientale]
MWKRKRKICGEFPDFGAIFMSNRTTFRDCLNSKLFGLPSSQSHFVKQVRAGMILFLFENEERELHGVFQATSDGQMNIMPKAYESSGKLFPAQVQCTRIWECDPLGESEFRDAIEENYYETKKFNFGLSQHQVCFCYYACFYSAFFRLQSSEIFGLS